MTNVRKKIKHLRSNQTVTVTENGVKKTKPLAPGLDDIDVGEIAINYAAGHEKIYVKNDDNFGGNQEVVGFANDNELNEMGEILSLAITEEKTARENAISGLNRTLLHDLTISTDYPDTEHGIGTYYITPARYYTVIKFKSNLEVEGDLTVGSDLTVGAISNSYKPVKISTLQTDNLTIDEDLNITGTIVDNVKVGTMQLGDATLTSSGTLLETDNLKVNDDLYVATISNSDYPVYIGTLETDNITINQDLNFNGQKISKDRDGVVRVAGTLIGSQITGKFGIGDATIQTFGDEINIHNLSATYFTSHSMSDIGSIITRSLETTNIYITGKTVDSVNVSTITLGDTKIIASDKTITIENDLNVKGVTDNGVKVGTIQLGNATIYSNNGTIITDALASNKIAVGNATLTSSGNVLKTGNLNVGDNLYAGTISNSTEPVNIGTLKTDILTVNKDLNITGTIVDDVKVGTIQLGNAVIKSKGNTINISGLESELIQTENFEIVKTEDGKTVGTMLLGDTEIKSDGIGTLAIGNKQLNINGYNDNGIQRAIVKLGDVTLTSSGTGLETDYLKVNHDLGVGKMLLGDTEIISDKIGTLTIANKQLNIFGYTDNGVKTAIVKLGDATLTSSGTTLKTDELHVDGGVEAKIISAIGEDYNNVRVSTINIGRTNLNSSGTLLKTDYLKVNHDLTVDIIRFGNVNATISSEDSEIKISNLKATTLNGTTISGTNISGTNVAGSSLVVEGPNMKIAGTTLDGGTVLVGSIKIGDAVIGAEDSVITLEELNVLGTNYNSSTIATIQLGNATISATDNIINIGSLSTNGVISVVGTKEESGDIINVGTIKLGDAFIGAEDRVINLEELNVLGTYYNRDVIGTIKFGRTTINTDMDGIHSNGTINAPIIFVGKAKINSDGTNVKTNLYYRPSILTGAGELFENVYTVEETLTKIIASLNSHNILP